MSTKRKYVSVAEYARIKKISRQAVYKKLNNQLSPFVKRVDNKVFISVSALSENERIEVEQLDNQQFNQVEQPYNQPTNPQNLEILGAQLAEKDKQIQTLFEQINSLQEQNLRLTEMLNNSQLMIAAHTKNILDTQTEKRKGFLSLFGRKKQ